MPIGLSRAQTLDFCYRLAAYSEAGPTPKELLLRAGSDAVLRFGDDAEVLVAVGRMYLLAEELLEAEQALRRATQCAPNDPHALRLLGEVLLRLGNPTAAHTALSSAVASGMNDPWTKMWVARALDYSELLDDLGREGIARDVRTVLGPPGQGPPEERRPEPPAQAPRPPIQGHPVARIDKGVHFAGDERFEPSSLSAGRPGAGEIADLPALPSVDDDDSLSDDDKTLAGDMAAHLARDASWADPPPGSEPTLPGDTDTEISEWSPEIERLRREYAEMAGEDEGASPVAIRSTGRPSPAPPPFPSLEAVAARMARGPAFPTLEAPAAARAPRGAAFPTLETPAVRPPRQPAFPTLETPAARAPRGPAFPTLETPAARAAQGPALPDLESTLRAAGSPARAAAKPLQRISAGELFDEFTEPQRRPGEPRPEPPAPPPLPDEPELPAPVLGRGRTVWSTEISPGVSLPGVVRPSPVINVIGSEIPMAPQSALMQSPATGELSPVTAPPSALMPIHSSAEPIPSTAEPLTAPPSALMPISEDPLTAPPSALLPPEPPSLAVPSMVMRGVGLKGVARAAAEAQHGGDLHHRVPRPAAGQPAVAPPGHLAAAAAPAVPQAAPPPLEQAPAPAPLPLTRKKRSRLETWLLRAAVGLLLAIALAAGFQLYKRNRATKIRTLVAQTTIALHNGGPRGVADAEAALAGARNIDPTSRPVAHAAVRTLFYAVIDVDPGRLPDLVSALRDAEAAGYQSSELAFAEVARAVASNDATGAAELIARHDQETEPVSDARYQLAAGIAVEPQDSKAAIERYLTAVKIDPELLSAELRLIRALAFAGRGSEAEARLQAANAAWAGRTELTVLAAIIALAPGASGSAKGIDPATDVDMLPRSLRGAARAMARSRDEAALAKATAEADIAPMVVICGEHALRAGHEATAREAAQRAIELTSGYAPGHALAARVGLAAGRFEEARQAASRAPKEASAEVLSFIAYESADLAAMIAAAGQRAEASLADPVAAGIARLRGAAPLEASEIAGLARSTAYWADVVAMDAALDAGDLETAQSIGAAWPGADKQPIRASRIGRLLRYQGKIGAAQAAASSAAPALAARIEGAFVAAESGNLRDGAAAAFEAGKLPAERWTAAYLLARQGKEVPARALVRSLAVPDGAAPLLMRTVAALTLAELKIKSPPQPMLGTLEVWRKNPDVARALGGRPAAPAPPGGAEPAPGAPEKPRPEEPAPKKGGDPY